MLLVTVPIVLVVTAVTALGLGELTARVNPAPPLRDTYVDFAASQLVTAPLVSAILARLVFLRARGEAFNATDLVADALEVFPAVLLVIVVWLAVSFLGFVSLIVPGFYIFVSWYFVVQAVVIDGYRGFAPISRSARLVRGHWWQSAIVGVAFQLAALLAAGDHRLRAHAGRPFRELLRDSRPRRCARERRRPAVPGDRRFDLLPAPAGRRRSARSRLRAAGAPSRRGEFRPRRPLRCDPCLPRLQRVPARPGGCRLRPCLARPRFASKVRPPRATRPGRPARLGVGKP